MKRVIITGATGTIGIALAGLHLSEGIEVFALCRPESLRKCHLPAHPLLHAVDCRIDDYKSLSGKISCADAFFHLAWTGTERQSRDDVQLQISNIGYAMDAVDAAAALGCSVFVGAGSQAEYGPVSGCLRPDTPAYPDTAYGVAKLCAGQMSRLACGRSGIRHVWARILSVYGPFDTENSMILSSIRKMLKGEECLFTPAEQIWDYLYADDAARALICMARLGKDSAVYPLGSGNGRALREYILEMRDAVDPSARIQIGAIPYVSGQVMHLCADISTLTQDTRFAPQIPFTEGIARTAGWIREKENR